LILFAGVSSGIVSAILATSSSLKNSRDIPWIYLVVMIVVIVLTGLFAMLLSVRSVTNASLIVSLRKE